MGGDGFSTTSESTTLDEIHPPAGALNSRPIANAVLFPRVIITLPYLPPSSAPPSCLLSGIFNLGTTLSLCPVAAFWIQVPSETVAAHRPRSDLAVLTQHFLPPATWYTHTLI